MRNLKLFMRKGEKSGFIPIQAFKKGRVAWNKNLKNPYSKKTLKKMSDSQKRIGTIPPSQKGKIPWNKNKTGIYSKETIQKIKAGRAKQVIKHSIESRRKIGIGHSKEKCTFWKGGISDLTRSLRQIIAGTFEYRQWRSDVFQRDDYICQHCREKGGKLNADHLKEFQKILLEYNIKNKEEALLCEELWNINNGRTLCESCHKKRKKWDKKIYD
jgi:hypothetical protein